MYGQTFDAGVGAISWIYVISAMSVEGHVFLDVISLEVFSTILEVASAYTVNVRLQLILRKL